MMVRFVVTMTGVLGVVASAARGGDGPALIRSARSGSWSATATWEGGKVPGAGDRVQVRDGHEVLYDLASDRVIRSIHVAGTLTFARDRDTRLDVGLIKIQSGDNADENGFDCDAHMPEADPSRPRPTLEVGTPDKPIPAGHTATIRLTYVEGMDKETCPAIVCCGGRLDLHGAPLSRTWVKLGATANGGLAGKLGVVGGGRDTEVKLADRVEGWRVGDRVIVTTTNSHDLAYRLDKGTIRNDSGPSPARTEERIVKSIDGDRLTLDRPLEYRHNGEGDYRGEVANLSRNVVIESADPAGVRGHTMYHRGSLGSISYAEFRHLGKEGVLGKYSIHFHKVGDTMRGSSVIGASIWDSGNRWITIHGTNYLVVRDCVGYRSVGHGFFLEDGTEAYNVLDRNLAVQAYAGKPLPQQALPFDHNDGAGFWWANSRNTFTRNVAVECDRYGFRFEATPSDGFNLRLPVLQPDGHREPVDIRLLSFIKFEDNEAHDHLLGVNLGGLGGDFFSAGLGGVVPDIEHPFVIRNLRVWNTHWAFSPHTRYAVDGLDIADSTYGLFVPSYDAAVAVPRSAEARDNPLGWGRVTFTRTQVPIRLPDATSDARFFGEAFDLMEFVRDPVPPTTVITHVSRTAAGALAVRGTSVDDGGWVAKVLVNGREAKATRPGFAEWEATLEGLPAGELKLAASAIDDVGNVEPRPHGMVLRWPEGLVLSQAWDEPRKPDAPAPRRAIADAPKAGAEGLQGMWAVVSQQRAGRPIDRPERMKWLIDDGEIWLLIGRAGEQYSARNKPALKHQGQRTSIPQGASRMRYRLSPGTTPARIDVAGPKKAAYRGVYRLDGDVLTVCLGSSKPPPGYGAAEEKGGAEGDRPTGFDPELGTVIVLKRLRD